MRVALLSLHARAESYLDDSGLRALEAPLVARGHRATLIEGVQGAGGDWLAAVAGRLRAEPYDLAVLSRAWSEDLVDLVRAALPAGGRLVRLGRGAASPLDPRFDAVLDHDGLLAYVDGGAPNAAAWRRTRDALKVLRAPPPDGPGSELPAPGRALVDVSGSAGRPTLSGPASGCPFLLDVRASPAFADTALDPARTQTKGCSFCLDNVGAYAAFPAEEVVGAWLAGLRRIRAARPDAREILLTDERPHPYLPAFFRALLDEPGLAPVELLIKTRVDWLLEFADGALSEALALAERGGHVLHVYLVGFESFEQHHLDLFNKGVTVADNLAAAARLRALGQRFPRSLEYRRLRAHGIILFTPWTRPEALVENARQMRAVDFAEFRSQALRTRLRLYPHVPLHAKAAAEGLLVEGFEAGRSDRAAEQGYDASVPWRFQDPRTEAVYRAANRLAGEEPALAEADVLELAARFVLRHPGLGAVPDEAVLPLRAALRTWGPSTAEVLDALGPALAGCDREVDGVLAGAKPACLKEGVPAADAAGLARAYRAMGLAAELVSRHDLDDASGDHAPDRPAGAYAIVAVARDEATLASVLAHQRALEQQHDADAVTRMGALMGFPPCCTAAFHGRRDRGDNLDLERAPFREHPEAPLRVENSRFGPFSLLSHLLCSPACEASAAGALAVLDRLRAEDAAAVERAWPHLAAPALFCDYARRARLRGRWSGEEFLVESLVVPPGAGLGVPTDGVASLALSPGGVRLRYRDGSERRLHAANPLLVEPGRALAPAALAALAPGPADDAPPSPPDDLPSAPPAASDEHLPALPPGVTRGRRFGEYQVAAVRSTPAA
ncbi:MAG: hypothetical protein Q8S73_43365, partial [Deltaproteobacteria bacterium]|nr:hypothetical protein [Deltaproteobacteria bacterium]